MGKHHNRVLIKNGKVVTSSGAKNCDILIENEIITGLGNKFDTNNTEIIDAEKCYVIPGGVDVHTHLNLHVGKNVAKDDFYTGTVAAACGGTTSIVDHMGFGPKNCNLMHQVNVYNKYAEGNAVIDYSFHGVLQHIDKSILDELKVLINKGISSF